MLRYKTKTRPGLVALYDIRPGSRAVYSYIPRACMGHTQHKAFTWATPENHLLAVFKRPF